MRRLPILALLAMPLAACADADAANEQPAEAAVAGQELPSLLVYKTPTCGCCTGWIAHMREAGFAVDARDVTDIMSVKLDAGIPAGASSCHTTLVDGYYVEGHVPAEQVKRLLVERPDIAGIAVPGMPTGSPGMEGPNARPYQVVAIAHDGTATVFAEVDPR